MKDSTCKDKNCSTTVSCGVRECAHNEAETCMADHISISGAHASSCRETECDTFCNC
jgi:hypothetical protein